MVTNCLYRGNISLQNGGIVILFTLSDRFGPVGGRMVTW